MSTETPHPSEPVCRYGHEDCGWLTQHAQQRPSVMCRCGHPASHHDAGECWTDAHGQPVTDFSTCLCHWYEPADSDPQAESRMSGQQEHGSG